MSWFGKHKTKQGDAVYIACEGRDSMMRRTTAWEILKNNGQEVDSIYLSDAEIVINTNENAYNSSEALANFMDGESISPLVIVIDTMNYSLGNSKENDANDMTEYFRRIAQNLIRRFNATVILVHHTNKDGTDIRGSSTIRGALDALFLINKVGEQHIVKNDKHKDIEQINTLYLDTKVTNFTLPDGSNDANIALFMGQQHLSANGFTPAQQKLLDVMEKVVGVGGTMIKSELILKLGADKGNFAKNYLKPLLNERFISANKSSVTLIKTEGAADDFEI
jgi:hypothetical protein